MVWREYLSGRKQTDIAADFDISQQRVSQIISEVRATVGDRDRSVMAMMDMERLTFLMDAQMPAAMKGDVGASRVVLAALARRAKMLGLDAAEPLRVTLERDTNVAGDLVSEALVAALGAVELTQEERVAALTAAQAVLLGEPVPEPVSASAAVVEESDPRAAMERKLRDLTADEDIDVDALLAEVDDEEEGGAGGR
ncbi:hypothetical protein ADL12_32155 [Streptomyces regalis]|uniref:Uncharacterized protein n=1 Tax=Streptomyces regalis TaxID=68262 RepID=A0A101JH15_9ACTN|nr:hypothetical protein ADL12_32155 [Streptomyces regalis]